jgi:hypothetical protein
LLISSSLCIKSKYIDSIVAESLSQSDTSNIPPTASSESDPAVSTVAQSNTDPDEATPAAQAYERRRPVPFPRLFSLFPTPSMKYRFVTINNENINGFASQGYSANKSYNGGLRAFHNALDFSKIPGHSINR